MFKHINKETVLGVDIGGSHIVSALVDTRNSLVYEETINSRQVNTKDDFHTIISQWVQTLKSTLKYVPALNGNENQFKGIGISMPGPFNYGEGISHIEGVDKFERLFGVNIHQALRSSLNLPVSLPIVFENDASCFGLGESLTGEINAYKKVIAITLGTGFGATFLNEHRILKDGIGVPPGGVLYNIQYKDGIAENYISTRGLIAAYNNLSGQKVSNVKEIADYANFHNDHNALKVFEQFGEQIAECMIYWIREFNAECLVIGGSISKASELFVPAIKNYLIEKEVDIQIKISKKMELSAITGAAALVVEQEQVIGNPIQQESLWRKTTQSLMPQQLEVSKVPGSVNNKYNIYPYHPLKAGSIYTNFHQLGEWITIHETVIIDGYIGTDWTALRNYLSEYFQNANVNVLWYDVSACQKTSEEVDEMVKPFLGEPGTVWGKRTTLKLKDFFDQQKLEKLNPDNSFDVNIIIGEGAALCNWKAPVIYVDLPKNELQYRMRAGTAGNLATRTRTISSQTYKRYYFVDWIVLNEHRREIKDKIEVVVDGQWREKISWAFSNSIKNSLAHICHSIVRVRPWFEAGAWGGQWLKNNVPGLNKEEVNYAWSFELIVPENGIVFEHEGNLLEISFDWLMEHNNKAVLGRDAARFGNEFPIRFDFLDTFDGGNLSIQCHPGVQYIQKEFGERITQDETYYILDCKDDAQVYLGFQDNINADEFRSELENSNETNSEVDIEKFVRKFPSKKHELYLIPNGTIHSSGTNNLVLEISATPYIFTFKMYDWLRLDLNGEPRPINIDHAFKNLNFDRKGKTVEQELISKPSVIERGQGYQVVHLPTHADHFYDIHRIEITDSVKLNTNDQCHVFMLVEGSNVTVITERGEEMNFSYAETFLIPAAAGSYKLINKEKEMIKVIKAFIK